MVAEENLPFDPEECGRFYEEHQYWLRGVIRSAMGANCKSEDVLQSFLLRLMERPVPRAAIDSRGYCYRMLKNFIIDAKRSDHTYERHVQNFAQIHNWAIPFKAPKKASVEHVLQNAIRYLPSRIAQAVKLRLIEEYTAEEVAKKMCVDKKTAIKYVSDGKNKLRDMLRKRQQVLIFVLFWFVVR